MAIRRLPDSTGWHLQTRQFSLRHDRRSHFADHTKNRVLILPDWITHAPVGQSDTPRRAGGLVSWTASKMVGYRVEASR